jgi:hypothetical protein
MSVMSVTKGALGNWFQIFSQIKPTAVIIHLKEPKVYGGSVSLEWKYLGGTL